MVLFQIFPDFWSGLCLVHDILTRLGLKSLHSIFLREGKARRDNYSPGTAQAERWIG
jgi:hypothetical protein